MAIAVALPAASCELVIGDAPAKKPQLEGGTGGTSPGSGGTVGTAGLNSMGGGGKPSSGGAPLGTGGSVSSGGSGGRTDVGPPPQAGSGGRDIHDAGNPDSGVFDAGPPCTSDVLWYEDADQDGYGTDTSTLACPKPAGNWARRKGDCDDANADVHPDQKRYFGVPYTRADNTGSFDYDCSGAEEPNPSLVPAPADCGLLQLALCSDAAGYETNTRQGAGINPWCGSTNVRVCIPKTLGCETTERTNQPPFSCR